MTALEQNDHLDRNATSKIHYARSSINWSIKCESAILSPIPAYIIAVLYLVSFSYLAPLKRTSEQIQYLSYGFIDISTRIQWPNRQQSD